MFRSTFHTEQTKLVLQPFGTGPPLFATEHDANFDNVMVIDSFASATMEASTTSLIVGNDSSAYYLPTSIDKQGGYVATENFRPGATADKNLQKITFSQNYRSGVNYNIGRGIAPAEPE